MSVLDFYQRRAGILLHPTSLPSGKLNRDVERWLELMDNSGFSLWQMLPLGEPKDGLSPYQCISAFSMNPALIDDYPPVEIELPAFVEFRLLNDKWLNDYALFKVGKKKFGDKPWYEWPGEWKHKHDDVMEYVREEFIDEINLLIWQQFKLYERWAKIKRNAHKKGILLFGDIPLFVAHDSVDVWANPDQFLLDEKGHLSAVTGVPPDYFSDTGQRWGNPHYDWDAMKKDNFSWWVRRFIHHLKLFDLVRIDHFRGLESAWVIEPSCPTAIDGYWKKSPGEEILTSIIKKVGRLPVIAEDLGIITAEVKALRKRFRLPGMAVLQFSFDSHDDNPHKPKNIETDCVVYTGTHDNDTAKGWFESLDENAKSKVLNDLNINRDNATGDLADVVVDALIVTAMNTKASLCVVPMQDCLRLGTKDRMNVPGTESGNWTWSFQWEQVLPSHIAFIRDLIEKSDRLVVVD